MNQKTRKNKYVIQETEVAFFVTARAGTNALLSHLIINSFYDQYPRRLFLRLKLREISFLRIQFRYLQVDNIKTQTHYNYFNRITCSIESKLVMYKSDDASRARSSLYKRSERERIYKYIYIYIYFLTPFLTFQSQLYIFFRASWLIARKKEFLAIFSGVKKSVLGHV